MSGSVWQWIYLGIGINSLVTRLTDREFAALQDDSFLRTKSRVSEKIIETLAEAEARIKLLVNETTFSFPEGTKIKAGKISRGENYRGLPYFVLDYPRLFDSDNMFAYRVILWWGHEISYTLLLGRQSKERFGPKLLAHRPELSDWFLCVHGTPWEHHFGDDNYRPVKVLSDDDFQQHTQEKDFIKLSQKQPISKLSVLPEAAADNLAFLLGMLSP